MRGEYSFVCASLLDFSLLISAVGVQGRKKDCTLERVSALIHVWYGVSVASSKAIQPSIVCKESEWSVFLSCGDYVCDPFYVRWFDIVLRKHFIDLDSLELTYDGSSLVRLRVDVVRDV